MANIMKDDVQTYVRKLISKEFGSNHNEEKARSDSRKLNTDGNRYGQNQPVCNDLSTEEK